MLSPNFISMALAVFLICASDATAAPSAPAATTAADIVAASTIVSNVAPAPAIVADVASPSAVVANGTLAAAFGITIGVNSRDIIAWISNDYYSQCYNSVPLGPVRDTYAYITLKYILIMCNY